MTSTDVSLTPALISVLSTAIAIASLPVAGATCSAIASAFALVGTIVGFAAGSWIATRVRTPT